MAGSVLSPISKDSLDALKRRAAILPPEEFQHWVAIYRIERMHVRLSPAKARKQLDALVSSADAFLLALNTAIDDEAVWDYLSWETRASHDFSLPVRLKEDIRTLAGLAENARRQAEIDVGRGRGLSPQTKLIHRLAKAIERAGQEPDETPNGALVQAFEIAMKETGHNIADMRGTVRSALDSYSRGQ